MCAFNLAETSKMLEIAEGAAGATPWTNKIFASHFISDGGDFQSMIEKNGFASTRMNPVSPRNR